MYAYPYVVWVIMTSENTLTVRRPGKQESGL